ncbi:MAG: LruC domain-containing protein [Candidatus Cloacimonetes bacterium]|nr:LruC domain-containing protein [Candidatus Cloacimonadota bacterium]
MKGKIKIFGFLLILSVLLISCSTNNDNEITDKEMTDLVISEDFNFTTHRDVEVNLRAFYSGVFYIYDLNDNLLKKGLIDIQDGYHGIISIPNDISNVKLVYSEVEDMEADYEIINNTIDYNFYPDQEEVRGEVRDEDQVHPILECIEHLGDGMFLAHYGYLNDYDSVQQIPIGSMNMLQNTPYQDMGQPTLFQPGRHENVFTVEFPGEGYRDEEIFYIKWKLGGTFGEGFARADSTSTVCPRGFYDDDDNDGVLNDDDDFPYDDTRAFLNHYPGDDSLTWGTLAYEDRWPLMGDYDFNDVIISYRFETVDDPADHLLEVFGYFVLRASGAGYQNGFALELPFPAENVEELTYTDLAGSGVEGVDSQIINFFANALEIMNKPQDSEFVNTQPSDPYLTPVAFEFYLKLTEAVDESALPWQLPYNPFIVVDQNSGREVHLPDMPPTYLADQLLFGTEDDNSEPGNNRYYKTATNLPWAINLPIEWDYPKERIAIIDTYNYFGDWAESSGAVHNDWYENTVDNVVEENIYQTP